MGRPSTCRIRDLLRDENALLVHFSGLSNSSDHYYPDDLLFARDAPHKTRCCSSVRYQLSTSGDHLWGQVGIIVDPIEEDAVQLVRKEDGGTLNTEAGEKFGDPKDVNYTMDVLLSAIHRTERHDEWLVGPYKVRCVFVTNTEPMIRVASSVNDIPGSEDLPDGMRSTTPQDLPKPISIGQIENDLRLPVYSFTQDGKLVRLKGDGSQNEISINDICPIC